MVDRLQLTPRCIETMAKGCEQLAAMPDPVGEITGMKQQPSGIAWARCACPSACSA
jgi:glutamate-5-semialdehyde dehydrogenase